MKNIILLCALWLACSGNFFKTNSAFARTPGTKTITGKVIDDRTSLPMVANLKVSASGWNVFEFTTDSLGQFTVPVPEVNQCRILVSAAGFNQKIATIEISGSTSNYVEIRLSPIPILALDGKVFGGAPGNENPIDATLTVYLNSDFIKAGSVMAINGKYSESLSDFGWYILDFSAPGYATVTDTLWVMNTSRKSIHKDYHLVPLDSKLTTIMNSIHFDFGKSTLKPECHSELNYLAQFLKHNATKQLEISGYTDSTGPAEFNLILSRARAQAVAQYMVSQGVDKNQLIAKGYGEQRTAVTEAAKRSVELAVIEKSANVIQKQ